MHVATARGNPYKAVRQNVLALHGSEQIRTKSRSKGQKEAQHIHCCTATLLRHNLWYDGPPMIPANIAFISQTSVGDSREFCAVLGGSTFCFMFESTSGASDTSVVSTPNRVRQVKPLTDRGLSKLSWCGARASAASLFGMRICKL